MAKGLIWFRADLRLDDNPALNAALSECEEVLAIYIFSHSQWKIHNESNIKHEFLINNLILLKESLQSLGISLVSINTKSYEDLPKDLCSIAVEQKVDHVFWNNEFGYNETIRDQNSIKLLKENNICSSSFHDQVIYTPGYLKTGQGNPFSVFTPYKRRWVENFDMNFLDIAKVS